MTGRPIAFRLSGALLAIAALVPATHARAPVPDWRSDITSALERLRTRTDEKLVHDIDRIAAGFSDAENIGRSLNVVYVAQILPTLIEGTISILGDLKTLTQLRGKFWDAEDSLALVGVTAAISSAKDLGENLQFALDGPGYLSHVSALLNNAAATQQPFAGYPFGPAFDGFSYGSVIKNAIWGVSGENLVVIGDKYACPSPRAPQDSFAWCSNTPIRGVLEYRRRVKALIDEAKAAVAGLDLDASQAASLVKTINQVTAAVQSSRLGPSVASYAVYRPRFGREPVLSAVSVDLGAPASLERFRIEVLGRFRVGLEIERETTVTGAASAAVGAALLTTSTLRLDKSKSLTFVDRVLTKMEVGEFALSPVKRFFQESARDHLMLLPQEMLLALPNELSNLLVVVRDVNRIVRPRIKPKVTWSAPAEISYGTALSSTQLKASSDVAGAFAYTPPAGTVLNVGTHPLKATFTPTDQGAATTGTATVSIVVTKATPKITWPAPAAIPYGTALGAAQLKATSNLAGSFAYTPAAGVVLKTGTHTLNTVFTPTDARNVASGSGKVTITVTKAVPQITWPTPASIPAGTALSAAQLKATANVPGSMTYVPAIGTALKPGTHTLKATFKPADAVNVAPGTASVTLVVTKAAPKLAWTAPSPIVYGTPLGTAQLRATSNLPGSFAYAPAAGAVLKAGTQTLKATFTPADASSVASATATVSLVVNKATPKLTWSAPGAIVYGTPLGATQLRATANLPGSFVYSPAAGTVLRGGTHTLKATFTPTDSANAAVASTTVTLTVTKATPKLAWSVPSAIVYGTPLGAAQLRATSNLPGSFVYSPAAGALLRAGTHTLRATFTPADSSSVTSGSASVSLVVTKATPKITWPAPAAITYGTPLSAAQLRATSNLPGTFIYSPASGSLLRAGTHTLRATFAAADPVSVNAASASVTLVVTRATPRITWSAPGPIVYGTALSASQLRATSNFPGSFSYSPGTGTVLRAGTHTLRATFTPADPANVASTTAAVTLVVNKATPKITWSAPSSIVYGTRLSATQLRATASFPGSFVYSPAAGTLLRVGTHAIRATFMPADSTSVASASVTVTIVVRAK